MTSSAGEYEQEHDGRFKACLTIPDAAGENKTIINYVVNMSTGGMFVETSEVLPVDTVLRVEIMLPGSETSLKYNARVAWTNGPHTFKKQSLPYGMGLQFLTSLAG